MVSEATVVVRDAAGPVLRTGTAFFLCAAVEDIANAPMMRNTLTSTFAHGVIDGRLAQKLLLIQLNLMSLQ